MDVDRLTKYYYPSQLENLAETRPKVMAPAHNLMLYKSIYPFLIMVTRNNIAYSFCLIYSLFLPYSCHN